MRTILLLLILLSFSASGQSAETLIKRGVDLIKINSDSAIVRKGTTAETQTLCAGRSD